MDKCTYCSKEATQKFGMKVPVCFTHFKELFDEQVAYYNGDITDEERELMLIARKLGYYKQPVSE